MIELSAADQLEEILANRSQPLLIKIDEHDCIVAAHCGYDSKHYMGIVFRHSEGPIDIGVDPPSRRETFEAQINRFELMSVDEQREAIAVEILGEDPSPDASNGEFEEWLNQTIDDDWTLEQWAESADMTLGDGTPGFIVLRNLSNEEAEQLGLRIVDLGGPASSCEMVQFTGDLGALQQTLETKGLPVRLILSEV